MSYCFLPTNTFLVGDFDSNFVDDDFDGDLNGDLLGEPDGVLDGDLFGNFVVEDGVRRCGRIRWHFSLLSLPDDPATATLQSLSLVLTEMLRFPRLFAKLGNEQEELRRFFLCAQVLCIEHSSWGCCLRT